MQIWACGQLITTRSESNKQRRQLQQRHASQLHGRAVVAGGGGGDDGLSGVSAVRGAIKLCVFLPIDIIAFGLRSTVQRTDVYTFPHLSG